MNERIKELITQARGHWNHGDFNMPKSVEFQEEDIAKFAESIIKECAELCLTNETFEGMFHKMEYRKGRHFNTIIKQHFGVEQ
jgi:hypothetical protein